MTPTAHDLVARGAALLDEKLPGWADQIDLDTLQMADPCRCVLGQLGSQQVNLDALSWHIKYRNSSLPGYYKLIDALKIRSWQTGFNMPDDGEVGFDDLQDAWKGEIVARRTL